jgi:hypothetical protein
MTATFPSSFPMVFLFLLRGCDVNPVACAGWVSNTRCLSSSSESRKSKPMTISASCPRESEPSTLRLSGSRPSDAPAPGVVSAAVAFLKESERRIRTFFIRSLIVPTSDSANSVQPATQ